jgi:signal transduction histidine kinase
MEERHRLARELHDSVTQALYSVSLYADAASLAIGSGKGDVAAKHMGTLRSLAREAMLEMRLLIFELHPPTLENEGLAGAIGTRLATVEARAGLETEMTVAGKGDGLSAEIEGALYRFAQEALNNVIKHSKAHNVRVRIQFETSFVTLEVADDGIGFDQEEAAQTGGIGLRGMRERLERLGGRVVVRSAPGKGASLMAEVDR